MDTASAQRMYDAGQFTAAAEVLERVVREDPTDVGARRRLGLAYAAQGKTQLAVKQYSAVVDLAPRDHETLFRLALLERQLGHVDEANVLLARALEVRPSEQSYLEERARTMVQAGEITRGVAVYDRLLKRSGLTPQRTVALLVERGQALLAAGRVDDARRSFERAASIDPTDVTVRRMLRRTK